MTTGKFHWRFGKIMMTLLRLDIDVIITFITFIIAILRKIKEQQVMPRLMWSLSASSLVVRRQLATRPHDHLQLYIFFSIAIFGSNHVQLNSQHVHTTIFNIFPTTISNPISFATRSLLVLCTRKKLFSSHVKCHSTCDPSSTLKLFFFGSNHVQLISFKSPFKSLNWQS